MRLILPIALSFLTINLTLSASTYMTISGSVQDILETSGDAHPYSGGILAPYAYRPFADLYSADLSGANLYRANLTGADLARSDLTGSDLFRAELVGVNLYGANLTGANLARSDLTLANLYGANLYGADLIGANFYAAWLKSANFSYADLTNVSNVDTAVWTNSNLFGATLPDGYDQAWFESAGALFVVPETSSYAILLGSLALSLVALRRR